MYRFFNKMKQSYMLINNAYILYTSISVSHGRWIYSKDEDGNLIINKGIQ